MLQWSFFNFIVAWISSQLYEQKEGLFIFALLLLDLTLYLRLSNSDFCLCIISQKTYFYMACKNQTMLHHKMSYYKKNISTLSNFNWSLMLQTLPCISDLFYKFLFVDKTHLRPNIQHSCIIVL